MLDAIRDAVRKSSIHVCIVNCGGCNGCDVECVAMLSPRYDLEQYGIYVHNNPREADVLLLTGAVTEVVVISDVVDSQSRFVCDHRIVASYYESPVFGTVVPTVSIISFDAYLPSGGVS